MNVVNLMEFRHSLDESEMEIYGPGRKLEMEHGWSRDLNGDETGPVWMWVAHLQTLMCLIWWLDESVDIFKTWMEVRRFIDWYEMQIYVHLEIRMGLRLDMDGIEMQFYGPGWSWNITWVEVSRKYQDMDWGETRHEYRWDLNLVTWI